MSVQRCGGRNSMMTTATILILGILAIWSLPLYAEDDAPAEEGKNAIGVQFGIDGSQLPFVKPFISRWFTAADVVCGQDGDCGPFTLAEGACCEKPVGDVVAHFCRQDSECGVCSETASPHEIVVPGHAPPPVWERLAEALADRARLEAELDNWERFNEERRELTEALLHQEIENAQLRAELELAEQRNELQHKLMETMAENIRLKAEADLAKQKQQFVEQYAKGMFENEKLKMQVANLEKSKPGARRNGLKQTKAACKAKVAKCKKADKPLRTAQQPAKEADGVKK